MTKYALIIPGATQYGRGDQYIPLVREGGTLEQAIGVALETFADGEVVSFDHDVNFEIIEITAKHEYNTRDYNEFFEKRTAMYMAERQKQQDMLDKEQFERLKKKFGA